METERQEREQRTDEWVEREPMWDGNGMKQRSIYKSSGLSENQCGMETVSPD